MVIQHMLGAFIPERSAKAITNFQTLVGQHQDIIMFYQAWGNGGLDTERINWIIKNGSIPMVTWEPWAWGGGINQPDYKLSNITAGKHDAYIRNFAQQVKSIGKRIFIRPMHEMNGDWYPWSGTENGNKPSDYIPAFRHIIDIFKQEGATSVRWVWCPNASGLPFSKAF